MEEGFVETFWGENERVKEWWMVRVMMMKLMSWDDQEEEMDEETDEVVADEKSQEVDSRDEMLNIKKSDQWF